MFRIVGKMDLMMKKSKRLICGLVATAIVMGGSLTAGCITTYNERDMKQKVAEVNISKNEQFQKQFPEYYSAVTTTEFIKRDMISAYVNGYYQLGQSGYSNAYIFNAIKDALVNDAVVTQYATVYLLKHKVEVGEDGEKLSLEKFKGFTTEKEKYEYLVGEEGVKKAKYNLYTTLNDLLDSNEKTFIAEDKKNKGEDKEEYEGTGTRTTPKGVDTEKEDYVSENYAVYTGYDGYLLGPAKDGGYEPLDGTNIITRRKAYSKLISNLKGNYLITGEDVESTDIMELSYVQNTYVSQLQQVVIEQFNDAYEDAQVAKIDMVDEDGVYTYVQAKYNGKQDGELTAQEITNSSTTAFESTLGTLSDKSFILYSPSTANDTEWDDATSTYGTFGYVFNILLPFSATQEIELKALQSRRDNDVIDESGYFFARNKLLQNIVTTDQRSAWFNGETDYSFNAKKAELDYYGKDNGRDYLFFENNLTKTDKYEELDKYVGLYSYNGTVTENKNGSYKLVPNKLDIDGMLKEFSAYINYVLGSDGNVETHAGDSMTGSTTDFTGYYKNTEFNKADDDKAIDYGKLVYATGKVKFDETSADMFVKDKNRYKAMSAVNELQYAYTTDTGVLSQYIGYTVSAYETSYIKEFEYAAQQALRMGAGAFKVCAGDYGWHLIYVTETFDFNGGEVYKGVSFTKDRIEEEGTFENRFYNWYKDSVIAAQTSLKRSEILKDFNTEDAVKVYEKAYKDLTKIR